MNKKMILYQSHYSGNCYKVRLLLHQLGIPVQLVEINTKAGETKTADFLAKNPNGKVPTIEISPENYLAESNAILWYFAEETDFLPITKRGRASVLQWLFFEQYSHEPYIAVVRNWLGYVGVPNGKEVELKERQEKGYQALNVMEQALQSASFFVDNQYSIADIALYAYTHVAHEGGFKFEKYPAILAWLQRVAAQPKHLRITE